MKLRIYLLSAALSSAICLPTAVSYAETIPRGTSVDPRVKSVTYNENDVISLTGHYGYQTTISFSPSEQIQNISIGDSISWQVVPNKAGNLLFVKPVEENATTNMTVITDKRIYNFSMEAETPGLAGRPAVTYLLKFTYPFETVQDFSGSYPAGTASPTGYNSSYTGGFDSSRPYAPPSQIKPTGIAAVGAPRDLNFGYSFKGDNMLKPNTVFDNGEFTYFKFRDMNDLPAIFEVDSDRNESVVNFRVEDGYVVVNSIGGQFTLRHGIDEACVFNDDFNSSEAVTTLSELN